MQSVPFGYLSDWQSKVKTRLNASFTNHWFRKTLPLLFFILLTSGCAMTGHTDTRKSRPTFLESADLRVSFETASSVVLSGDALPLKMTLVNKGDEPVSFLPTNSAFEEQVQADVFEVLLNGELQPYIGIVSRRLPVTLEDVVLLQPGETLERTINIAELYRMSSPGEYEIRYVPRQLVVDPELGIAFGEVSIDTDGLLVSIE